jgi:hypothetical protein
VVECRILRGRWYVIIVLNVHAPTEDITDNTKKKNFYKELEHIFDQFPKYHIKFLLEDFNAKVGRVNVFKTKKLGMSVYAKFVMIMELE